MIVRDVEDVPVLEDEQLQPQLTYSFFGKLNPFSAPSSCTRPRTTLDGEEFRVHHFNRRVSLYLGSRMSIYCSMDFQIDIETFIDPVRRIFGDYPVPVKNTTAAVVVLVSWQQE